VCEVIDTRRQPAAARDDLVSMLLAARDEETGEGMSARQLRDEVMTFFLAGHETTANALAWTWYLLAQHPEIGEAVRSEVAQAIGTRPPTQADLARMPLARMVVEEAMRLYPPTPSASVPAPTTGGRASRISHSAAGPASASARPSR
jgi:cytochrome P450